MNRIQYVSLGQTQSGVYGYFTYGTLAMSLSQENFNKPNEWHVKNAARYGFTFVE